MTKVFRNRNFTKRNYECTNIVACVAEVAPVTPDGRWIEADASLLKGLDQIYTQAGVTYYGYP